MSKLKFFENFWLPNLKGPSFKYGSLKCRWEQIFSGLGGEVLSGFLISKNLLYYVI